MNKKEFLKHYLEYAIKNKEDIQEITEKTKEKAYKILYYLLVSLSIACGLLFNKDILLFLKIVIILYSFINIIISFYLIKNMLSGYCLPNLYPILSSNIIDCLDNNKEIKNLDISDFATNHLILIDIKQAIKDYDKINDLNTKNTRILNKSINFCIINLIVCFCIIFYFLVFAAA